MNKTFKITCTVITPLFMGGAYQQPELRTQSINGILRWWFRAAGGSLEDEKRIFGWGGKISNQGLVRIFIKDFNEFQKQKFSKVFNNRGEVKQDSGINYIGFSLDQRFKRDQNDRVQREYIKENQSFEIKIFFHPKATESDIKKFFSSLWLAFNLGNFGSRSRRGFGSIKIEKIENENNNITNNCFELNFIPEGNIEDWIKKNLEKIKEILSSKPRGDIPYLFGNFNIYQIQKSNLKNLNNWINEVQQGRRGNYLKNFWNRNNINHWNDLLDFMGFLLMAYRSYRQPDYNNAKNILLNRKVNNPVFERAVFGLPLNFYFSSLRNRKNNRGIVHLKQGNQTLRRASPLMIKIVQNRNNYEGLFIVMKSTFMPINSVLIFSRVRVYLPNNNQWNVIDDFISSLQKYKLVKEIY